MAILTVVLCAYLIGSVSFAIVVTKLMGLSDPRDYGSGNPGATNVLRSGKKLAALWTLLGDTAKGALAVALARWILASHPQSELGVALAGLAAFLGHVYPVYFRFKGGKGVATALGILLAFDWMLGLAVLILWLIVVALTRYVSLASVVAAIAGAPLALWLDAPTVTAIAVSCMGLLIIWRHAGNIGRLRLGTESKLLAKKASEARQLSQIPPGTHPKGK